MAHPSWSGLYYFVVAARHGNLTRAAKTLHLTVSALSHRIETLEDRLGKSLFIRGSRGVKLTVDGQSLLEAVAPSFDRLEEELAQWQKERPETLSISTLTWIASNWLMPRMPRLIEVHPAIRFTLLTGTANVDFNREPIDAAIRLGNGNWPGVTAEFLFNEWLVPVASPALATSLTNTSPGEWPLLGDPGQSWTQWTDWYARIGVSPSLQVVAHFNDSTAASQAALDGLGVMLGPITGIRQLLDRGALQRLHPMTMQSRVAHYLVYPARSASHSLFCSFRDWLHEQAQAYQAEIMTQINQADFGW